jgi:hypothetical protein
MELPPALQALYPPALQPAYYLPTACRLWTSAYIGGCWSSKMRLAVCLLVAASSASACCRWAADQKCSPVVDKCTELHEYLEHKTTTHHFAHVDACLGSDPKKWAWHFDPASSSTTLSRGSGVVVAVPTPLRVTHAADCSGTTLSLQMDTVVLGSLTVGGLDVAQAFLDMGATPSTAASPPAAPPPCCRWSANPTCSPAGGECTRLHEYLERKTTTHHFEDVHACLGSDPEDWAWLFDGASSNTTLSNGSAAVAVVLTPLKVTHAAGCSGTAPTLTLQADTVEVLGSLTVGGFDVVATLRALGAHPESSQYAVALEVAGSGSHFRNTRRMQQSPRPEDRPSKDVGLQTSASVSALGGVSSNRRRLSQEPPTPPPRTPPRPRRHCRRRHRAFPLPRHRLAAAGALTRRAAPSETSAPSCTSTSST